MLKGLRVCETEEEEEEKETAAEAGAAADKGRKEKERIRLIFFLRQKMAAELNVVVLLNRSFQ